MQQPDKVIAGVWRALKRGGRFVGEFGGHEVRKQLHPWLCDSEGRWSADYVRLRFTAEKPED
jgi:hypothetical protein